MDPIWVVSAYTLLSISAATVVPWLVYGTVEYDAGLAVLTLTLIAVVWYTYLTHELTVNAEESLNLSRSLIKEREKRDAAHARGLRIVIGTHLTMLLPTLEDWKGSRGAVKRALSPGQFKQIVSELMSLMKESSVLEPEEQDHLSVILTNLSGLALLYQNGLSADVLAQSGDNQREMIRKLQALFGKHGILSGPIDVPWDPPPPGVLWPEPPVTAPTPGVPPSA